MLFLSVRWNQIRYHLYADVYDWITKPLECGRREAIALLDLKPGEKFLTVGCGTGADLEYVPQGADVTAIDITPKRVHRTTLRAERLGFNIDARVMDALSLTFKENEFDPRNSPSDSLCRSRT